MIKKTEKATSIRQKSKDTIEAAEIAARIADEKKADYIKIIEFILPLRHQLF